MHFGILPSRRSITEDKVITISPVALCESETSRKSPFANKLRGVDDSFDSRAASERLHLSHQMTPFLSLHCKCVCNPLVYSARIPSTRASTPMTLTFAI